MNKEELARKVRERLNTETVANMVGLGTVFGLDRDALEAAGNESLQKLAEMLIESIELEQIADILEIKLEPTTQPPPPAREPVLTEATMVRLVQNESELPRGETAEIKPKVDPANARIRAQVDDIVIGLERIKGTSRTSFLAQMEMWWPGDDDLSPEDHLKAVSDRLLEKSEEFLLHHNYNIQEFRAREVRAEKERDMLKKHETNIPLDGDEQPWLNRHTWRVLMIVGGIFALLLMRYWAAGQAETAKVTAEEQQRATLEMQTRAIEAIATRIAEKKISNLGIEDLRGDVRRNGRELGQLRSEVETMPEGLVHEGVLHEYTKVLERRLNTLEQKLAAPPAPAPAPKPVYDEIVGLKAKNAVLQRRLTDLELKATPPPAAPAPQQVYDGDESAEEKPLSQTPAASTASAADEKAARQLRELEELEGGEVPAPKSKAPRPVSVEVKEKVRRETITPSEADFQ